MLEDGDLRKSEQWTPILIRSAKRGPACQELLLLTVTRQAMEEILGDIVRIRPIGGN